ncbi:MAG: 50S ribosomal protein L3 [Armatimonadota bacterium]
MKRLQKALLGRKVGMTQLFADDGRALAVTVIEAGPCIVIQRKSAGREGVDALQLGYEELPRGKRLNKPLAGHFHKAGDKVKKEIAPCRHLRDFRLADCDAYAVGDRLTVEVFAVGEKVDVTGTSKGKGFAGGQKRHGFHGGPAAHGSMSHRRPASGGATDAARVFKGVKKPGHMGNVQRTVRRLRVHLVDGERNLLVLEGAVPGPSGQLVAVSQPAGSAGYAGPSKEGE